MVKCHLERKLNQRHLLGNFRSLKVYNAKVDFASNDYLGLSRSKEFFEKVQKEQNIHQMVGSRGSRLVSGNSTYIEELEEQIAAFHSSRHATLFNCGYMANLALVAVLEKAKYTLIFDEHVHASIRDGIKLSKIQAFGFFHNDLNHLEKRLQKLPGKKVICIESLYSTDGSMAKVEEIIQLAMRYQAQIVIDEAHSIGVYGKEGSGVIGDEISLDCILAKVVTFGKALGTFGAAIITNTLKSAFVNFAHSFIYSTALPFPVVSSIKCAYELLPKLDHEREKLKALVSYYKKQIRSSSSSQIQTINIPGAKQVKRLQEFLKCQGINVCAFTSPTVKRGKEVLRVLLHSYNTPSEIQKLSKIINRYIEV